MNHTPECIGQTHKCAQEIADYDARYPNYCRACNGTGWFTWHENQAPFGSGENWPEYMSEPCDDCLGQNKCPRCGYIQKTILEDDDFQQCENCGLGAYDGDGRPEPHECFCWETEYYDNLDRYTEYARELEYDDHDGDENT